METANTFALAAYLAKLKAHGIAYNLLPKKKCTSINMKLLMLQICTGGSWPTLTTK